MSFDWLNVPGLNIEDTNAGAKQNGAPLPPNVSFDFGMPPPINDNSGLTQDSRSVSDSALDMESVHSQSHNHLGSGALPSAQPRSQASFSDNNLPNQTNSQELVQYHETPDDLRVPLSLSQSQLTHEEIRTYLRWYKYILARSHSKLVKLNDVFRFLGNFTITESLKQRILAIFRSCKSALNIGQFFAVLRLISRAMIQGVLPSRRMILEKAPVPKPKPILSKQANGEVYEEVEEEEAPKTPGGGNAGSSVDFDSFTSLLLTGKTTRKRVRRKILNAEFRNKKVRFSESVTFQDAPTASSSSSDGGISMAQPSAMGSAANTPDTNDNSSADDANVPQGPLDLSLPMDQLLKLMAKRKHNNTALVSKLPSEQQETEEEKEELKDMQDSLSHFKQIQTVDAVTGLGQQQQFPPGFTPGNPGNAGAGGISEVPLQPLKPTATGSANHFMRQESNDAYINPQAQEPGNVMLPLKPTATGSANHFMREELNQNYGTHPQPQQQQSQSAGLQPLKPTATGSANYLMRSQFEPPQESQQPQTQGSVMFGQTPGTQNSNTGAHELQTQAPAPLKPTATGSANYLMKQQFTAPVSAPAPPVISPTQSPPKVEVTMPAMNNTQYHNSVSGDQFMNFPQQRQQIQQQNVPNLQYQNNANHMGSVSQQNTYTGGVQSNTSSNMPLHQQNTYPRTQVPGSSPNPPSLPQMQHPQPQQQQQQQVPTSNLLSSGQNAASSYFQSLLSSSHSPSPTGSRVQITAPSVISGQMQPNPSQPLYSGSNVNNQTSMYGGYQNNQQQQSIQQQPMQQQHPQQQPMQQQHQQQQPMQQQQQQQPMQQQQQHHPIQQQHTMTQQQYYPNPIQSPPPATGGYNPTSQPVNMNHQQHMQGTVSNNNQTQLGVPHYTFAQQPTHSPQPNSQILGNYQAMQNQMNTIQQQQQYGRR